MDEMKIPITQKLRMTKEKKDELQSDYQNQLLLYNILILNTYYMEIPYYISQKKQKY